MAKKKCRTPTRESAVKRELRTPLYRMRIVESKMKYKRNRKHQNTDYQFNRILRVLLNCRFAFTNNSITR